MSSKRLISAGLSIIVIALIWSFIVFPFLVKIPSDYENSFEFKGVNHTLNPQSLIMVEVPVTVNRTQKATSLDGNVVLINQTVTFRDASSGEEIVPLGSVEIFGVDRSSRQHVEGHGDADRNGLFTFPLDTKRTNYDFWVSIANQALEAEYLSKESFNGILIYDFKITEQRIPISANPLNGLPQEIDIVYDIKVEPISGIPVFVSTTSTIKLVQSANVKTPSLISSIRYTDDTIDRMVQKAKDTSNMILWSKTYGFWLAIGIGGVLFLLGLIKESNT